MGQMSLKQVPEATANFSHHWWITVAKAKDPGHRPLDYVRDAITSQEPSALAFSLGRQAHRPTANLRWDLTRQLQDELLTPDRSAGDDD
jgi:hypothetical protein